MNKYDNKEDFIYTRGLGTGGVELGCFENITLENAKRRARRLSKHETTRKNKKSFHDLTMSGEISDTHRISLTFNNGRQIQKLITGGKRESH